MSVSAHIRIWTFEDAPQSFRKVAIDHSVCKWLIHIPRNVALELEDNGNMPPFIEPISFVDAKQSSGGTVVKLPRGVEEDVLFSDWGIPELHKLDNGDFVLIFCSDSF